jgi:hypothetical protein
MVLDLGVGHADAVAGFGGPLSILLWAINTLRFNCRNEIRIANWRNKSINGWFPGSLHGHLG